MEHGPSGEIGADTMQRSAQIMAWHLHEAKRLMGNAEIPEALADARTLLGWLGAKGGKVSLKMVLNAGPAFGRFLQCGRSENRQHGNAGH